MSLNYTIGDLLLQGLDDYGISSQTIREGVLTAKKFSKIEHDEGLGDRMIWDWGCGRFLGPELSNSKTASILHRTQTP